ncbi:MAG: T9SS type A sorting domain-containing protein, partial [Bacteroidetes bacterium]
QDILLTGYGDLGQTVKVYRNDGNDLFTDANVLLPYINSGGAIWGDYDNDKDLDIAISGCIAGGALSKILRNDSLNVFTDIQANIKPLCISTLKWGDYDNDGDLDLAISGGEDFIHGTNPTTKIYRNDSGLFVDTDIRLQGTYFGSLNWGDYNNDGNIDLLMTGGTVSRPYYSYSGPFYPVTSIYKNNTQLRNIRPTAPASAAANVEENEITFSWDQANDNETPQHALTYNLRIGTMPGGTDIVAPSSNIFTGFRRLPKKGNSGYKNSWSLSNLPSGTYYWSVQAVDNEFAGSIFTDEQAVVVSSGVNTVSFSTNEGWNVVSVPLTVADYSAGTLFRSLGSQAFAYEGSYVVKDTLTNGSGYWLKFNTSGLINISGEFVSSQTIEVSEGWNLIGSISSPIDVTSITSVPGGLITSEFFEYNYGYSSSNTIEPGKGYWVRAETSGQLILSTSSSQSSNRIKIVSSSEQPPTPPNNTQPVQFRLDQNFPNPFNPSTNLQFHIGKAGFVSMKIYDMLGQEVANLVNEEKQPGDYSVVWDAKELPSGVYACKLISGESLSINKLLLIK